MKIHSQIQLINIHVELQTKHVAYIFLFWSSGTCFLGGLGVAECDNDAMMISETIEEDRHLGDQHRATIETPSHSVNFSQAIDDLEARLGPVKAWTDRDAISDQAWAHIHLKVSYLHPRQALQKEVGLAQSVKSSDPLHPPHKRT